MSFTEPQNVTLFENMVIADVSTISHDDTDWSRASPLSNVSGVLVRSWVETGTEEST